MSRSNGADRFFVNNDGRCYIIFPIYGIMNTVRSWVMTGFCQTFAWPVHRVIYCSEWICKHVLLFVSIITGDSLIEAALRNDMFNFLPSIQIWSVMLSTWSVTFFPCFVPRELVGLFSRACFPRDHAWNITLTSLFPTPLVVLVFFCLLFCNGYFPLNQFNQSFLLSLPSRMGIACYAAYVIEYTRLKSYDWRCTNRCVNVVCKCDCSYLCWWARYMCRCSDPCVRFNIFGGQKHFRRSRCRPLICSTDFCNITVIHHIVRTDHSNLSIKMILTSICDKKLIHNIIFPVQICIDIRRLLLNVNF